MVCVKCGVKFKTRGYARVCRSCREIARERMLRKRLAICWYCENAEGGCEWTRCFKPVPGWDAEPRIVKDDEGDIRTYHIRSCPKYKEYTGGKL